MFELSIQHLLRILASMMLAAHKRRVAVVEARLAQVDGNCRGAISAKFAEIVHAELENAERRLPMDVMPHAPE